MATDCMTTQEVLYTCSTRGWIRMGLPTDHTVTRWGLTETQESSHSCWLARGRGVYVFGNSIKRERECPDHRWHLGGTRPFGFQKANSWGTLHLHLAALKSGLSTSHGNSCHPYQSKYPNGKLHHEDGAHNQEPSNIWEKSISQKESRVQQIEELMPEEMKLIQNLSAVIHSGNSLQEEKI